MARNPAPRRGATRAPARKRKPARRDVPGWLWLVTGLGAGIFIMFLFNLGGVQNERASQPVALPAPQASRPAPARSEPPATEKPAETTGPKFDFYAVLPAMEVIVPPGEESRPAPAPPPAARSDTAASPPSQRPPQNQGSTASPSPRDSAATPPAAAGTARERFELQAGSFRRHEDADRRRGELILKGFSARIQPVALEGGDTWHRVMIGPYTSAQDMNAAKEKLAAAGIDTLAIRQRAPGG